MKIKILETRDVDQLEQQVDLMTRQGVHPGSSIFDLSRIETLTMSSLQSLIALRQTWQDAMIVLVVPSRGAQLMIRVAGYIDYFAIYSTVEDALAAIKLREALGLPGQVIQSRYQIEEKVAVGWLGTVLKATDLHLDYPVAIKVLSPTFCEETIAGFMDQAQQVMALNHPNIVRTVTWNQDEDHTFMVEELMTGPMLHDLLEETREPLFADQAMSIALDIANALEYAHDRGVILGDLKPRNVFLDADVGRGRSGVKLSGFGLWRLEQGRNLIEWPLLFLAAPWLAPEQILGQALDARTDLYALGVILYQMFTGSLPFEGTDQEVMRAHLLLSPHSPRELNPHISSSLEHAILKLLSKDPDDRYASAQQARDVLSSLAEEPH